MTNEKKLTRKALAMLDEGFAYHEVRTMLLRHIRNDRNLVEEIFADAYDELNQEPVTGGFGW